MVLTRGMRLGRTSRGGTSTHGPAQVTVRAEGRTRHLPARSRAHGRVLQRSKGSPLLLLLRRAERGRLGARLDDAMLAYVMTPLADRDTRPVDAFVNV